MSWWTTNDDHGSPVAGSRLSGLLQPVEDLEVELFKYAGLAHSVRRREQVPGAAPRLLRVSGAAGVPVTALSMKKKS